MLPDQISHQTVVIAPLDWGLGHATRCIQIIKQLFQQGNSIIFAGTIPQIQLIQKDFPDIIFEEVKGYNVQLDSNRSTYWQLLKQLRQMNRLVKDEKQIAAALVAKYDVDVIISDNRYGFFSPNTINIILTHQLNPQIPLFRKGVRKKIGAYISMFDHCWIPDVENYSICGELLNAQLSIPVQYIGHLSRFKANDAVAEFKYLAIVSGPEPERSRFLQVMKEALSKSQETYKIVSPLGEDVVLNPSTQELENLLNSCDMVISRAGYTTIMELIGLKKKALLIPTPGQYEQEYLAKTVNIQEIKFIAETQLESELERFKDRS